MNEEKKHSPDRKIKADGAAWRNKVIKQDSPFFIVDPESDPPSILSHSFCDNMKQSKERARVGKIKLLRSFFLDGEFSSQIKALTAIKNNSEGFGELAGLIKENVRSFTFRLSHQKYSFFPLTLIIGDCPTQPFSTKMLSRKTSSENCQFQWKRGENLWKTSARVKMQTILGSKKMANDGG